MQTLEIELVPSGQTYLRGSRPLVGKQTFPDSEAWNCSGSVGAWVCGMGWLLWCHLAICTLASLSMLQGTQADFICMYILFQWDPPFDAIEMDIVTSALVLLYKIRCMLKNKFRPFFLSSLSPVFSLWRPLQVHADTALKPYLTL